MRPGRIEYRKDILLLLLYSPGVADEVNEPIVGRTRLVKMLYLFRKEALSHFRKGTDVNEDNFYDFFAWDFGPFSREVYDDITFFILQGFIETSLSDEEALPESEAEWEEWLTSSGARDEGEEIDEYREESFRLTRAGTDFTRGMYETLSPTQQELLRQFKKRTGALPLRALLRYIYAKYPDDTTQSRIRDKILGSSWYH